MMTLLALALAVGIVIDDAIVVLENIFRFIEEKRLKPFPAAVLATHGDRPRRARDDAVADGGVPPGRVHGGIVGPLPRRASAYDGVRDRRLADRQLLAHADAVARAGSRRHDGHAPAAARSSASSTSFYRPIERVYMAILGFVDAPPLGDRASPASSRSARASRSRKTVPSGFLPRERQGAVRDQLRAPEGTSARRDARSIAERLAQRRARASRGRRARWSRSATTSSRRANLAQHLRRPRRSRARAQAVAASS